MGEIRCMGNIWKQIDLGQLRVIKAWSKPMEIDTEKKKKKEAYCIQSQD